MKYASGLNMIIICFLLHACVKKNSEATFNSTDSLSLKYSVITTLPHNEKAFTEGLVIYKNKTLESTGLKDQSWIAEVDQISGEHVKKVELESRYFGEGITVLNNKIYQLTYQERVGFIYDASTYSKKGEFTYQSEGWGITHNNQNLIMSDGTYKLYFLDTTNYHLVRTLTVTDGAGNKIKNLNELEYIDGYIFANVYESSEIVKIDPVSGKVVRRLDLSRLTNEIKGSYPNTLELNGIAYDQNTKALLVTGKYWPKAFLIKLQ